MRKIVSLINLMLIPLVLAACSGKEKLLMLNWGEYISDEVVADFEKEYNCDVVMSLADSNELFYSKIKSGTTVYDLVVPSDYMVEKMYKNDLLQEIDKSKLTNYSDEVYVSNVNAMIRDIDERVSGLSNYFIPYFFGTWGFMYNKTKPEIINTINKLAKTNDEYKIFFEHNKLIPNIKVAMYDNTRYAYAASMFYNKVDVNSSNKEALNLFKESLSNVKFNQWGTDTLKKAISAKNLDLAYVWTGDFLDMAYTDLENSTDHDSLEYDIYIPNNTISFIDSLVIPKKARNVDLAHKFIDFLLKPENALKNAMKVGYCTPINDTYNMIVDYKGNDVFRQNLAYFIPKYYPLNPNTKGYQGNLLADFNRHYVSDITTILNNSKI